MREKEGESVSDETRFNPGRAIGRKRNKETKVSECKAR